MELKQLGWNNYFEEKFKAFEEKGYKAGRIFAEHTHLYKVKTEQGEVLGEISGKLRYEASDREDYPAVGDWVAISVREDESRATIHGILPRKSKFSRKIAGLVTEEQILAANIDTVFLVNALNTDFSIRRIERYLILAWESGANPVIVLSKADLCEDIEEKITQVEIVAMGVPIAVTSSVEGTGMNEIDKYLREGATIALLGSSGVGKSSLINYLMGNEVQKVNAVREFDGKGRHTSTNRETFILPSGALIIDTPGMREIQMWEGDEGISEAFEDVEQYAKKCRFFDCKHHREPGCAVREAINNGLLSENRYESYKRLQKEIEFIERKQIMASRLDEKKKQKKSYIKLKEQII